MSLDEEAALAWLGALPEFDEVAREKLECLVALLREENTRQNLVSTASMEHVWQRHIVDSAQLLEHVPRGTAKTWMDLGTGAGFPGLVIAILCPDLELTMVEGRARRVEWLEKASEILDLTNARTIGSRLENVQTRAVSAISARAFAPLDALLQLSARFSTGDTIWLLPKGRSAAQELNSLSGWMHTFHVEPSVTDPEAGIVVGRLVGRKGARP